MPHVEPLREGDPAAVGPYRLVGRLGAGGQGVVYLGQARNGAPVAIKVLRDGLTGDDRFAQEIAAARRVEPFCIAQVLDASTGGRPYIVTEYVDGPSLQQAGRHTGTELQRLAVATATALAAIHQAGVVHRDFKPANVLLGPGGPRVIDFGIARALDSGVSATSSIVGTPAYMAPEQLAGQRVGPPSDVFAWASVIVFAASGVPPFGDDSLPAVINRILHNEPQLGELPRPLRDVVLACLAKDQAHRPTMQDVLLRLLGGQHAPASQHEAASAAAGPGPFAQGGGGPATRPSQGRRRGRTAVIAAVSGVTALALAGTIVWLTPSTPTPKATNLAVVTTGTTPAATATPPPNRTRKPRPTGQRPTTGSTGSTGTTGRPTGDATTPRATATTPRPATTRPSGGLRLLYVRTVGSWHVDPGCYAGGSVAVHAVVERTGSATVPFRYTWYFDGKSVDSGSALIVNDTEQVRPPHELQADGGRHVATLRITSPVSAQRSVSMVFCERETY
ncbi:serine/threonine-protein kinase [Nonomuraea sp. LPB2021202275-12-8]|uniref:serine/threonine-protein kinase n=1 Tax=Nonomuraea sp. LPB2021202275-12-8 TaxID=3120159 RepID=UPI00300CD40E